MIDDLSSHDQNLADFEARRQRVAASPFFKRPDDAPPDFELQVAPRPESSTWAGWALLAIFVALAALYAYGGYHWRAIWAFIRMTF